MSSFLMYKIFEKFFKKDFTFPSNESIIISERRNNQSRKGD